MAASPGQLIVLPAYNALKEVVAVADPGSLIGPFPTDRKWLEKDAHCSSRVDFMFLSAPTSCPPTPT